MATTTKTRTVCRDFTVFFGAGKVYDVPGVPVDDTGGTTLEALQKIAREHIRDPELIATLQNHRVTIQQFSDSEGKAHEKTLLPEERFSKVLEAVEDQTLELGVSVSHEGGVGG